MTPLEGSADGPPLRRLLYEVCISPCGGQPVRIRELTLDGELHAKASVSDRSGIAVQFGPGRSS